MDNLKQSLGYFAVLSLFFAVILCLYVSSSSVSNPFVSVRQEPLSEFINTVSFIQHIIYSCSCKYRLRCKNHNCRKEKKSGFYNQKLLKITVSMFIATLILRKILQLHIRVFFFFFFPSKQNMDILYFAERFHSLTSLLCFTILTVDRH